MDDGLETTLEAIEEEGDPFTKEEFIMLIFQDIMDKLPSFENSGPICSKISLRLLLVSVRLRF